MGALVGVKVQKVVDVSGGGTFILDEIGKLRDRFESALASRKIHWIITLVHRIDGL